MWLRIVLLALLLAVAAGCSGGVAPPPARVSTERLPPEVTGEPAAAAKRKPSLRRP